MNSMALESDAMLDRCGSDWPRALWVLSVCGSSWPSGAAPPTWSCSRGSAWVASSYPFIFFKLICCCIYRRLFLRNWRSIERQVPYLALGPGCSRTTSEETLACEDICARFLALDC